MNSRGALGPARHGWRFLVAAITVVLLGATVAPASAAPAAAAADDAVLVVLGVPQVGQPLTAVVPNAPNDIAITFNWWVDGAVVSYGTSGSYVPIVSDIGKTIVVTVTSSAPGEYDHDSEGNPLTFTTSRVWPASQGAVSIDGAIIVPTLGGALTTEARVGTTLTAAPSGWDAGVELSYSWRAGTAASVRTVGTGPSFTVGPEELSQSIAVVATGTELGFALPPVQSEWAGVSPGALTAPASVTISGSLRVGGTLRLATTGQWAPGTTTRIWWYYFPDHSTDADRRRWNPILGTTGSSLKLTVAYAGSRIRAEVHGSLTGYVDKWVTSQPTLSVPLSKLKAPRPKIVGVPRVGRTLRVVTNGWTKGAQLIVRWYIGSKPSSSGLYNVYIGSERSSSQSHDIKVTPSMRGKSLSVRVTGYLTGYVTVQKKSAATPPIKAALRRKDTKR